MIGRTVIEVRVDDLERRIAIECGQLNAGHGRLLDLVVEVVATDGWHGHGFRSPEHWIALRTGFSPSRSRQIVHLARRAAELPVTVQALREGRLSLDQAVVIGALIPAHNDAEACELAVHLAVSQLRYALGRYAFEPPYPPPPAGPADPDGTDPDRPVDTDTEPDETEADPVPARDPVEACMAPGDLSFFFDDERRFQLRLDAPLGDGLIVEQALREARDALFHAGQKNITWADAFNEICRRSLASNNITGIGASRADNFRVYIHLDTEGAWVNGTIRVPQALLDQIISDGIVRPVWTTGGTPVNVGRATKVISPTLRRLVLHRDGHRCRTPGCGSTLGLHVHHVHWYGRDDGPTDTWNLAVECGACHRHIHQGHINITGNADLPDGLVYTDEHGRSLIRHPVPIPPTAPPPDPAMPYRHPLGERLHPRWLWFKPTPEPAPAQAATTPGGPAPPATDAAA